MRTFNKDPITITEYGGFTRGVESQQYYKLPINTFDSLEEFILSNTTDRVDETFDLLSLSIKKNLGKVITAKNYVGLIALKDGTIIEILPKIVGEEVTQQESKKILLDMLQSLNELQFKKLNMSSLDTSRMNLFEVFIKMFLDEVTILTKQGLRSSYSQVESNERFYKGKLIASKNIKYNFINKEKFYVRFDEFNLDRAENRLIKSTLKLILKLSSNYQNRQLSTRLLSYFDNVRLSDNYDQDISNCIIDRGTNHYDKAITWCKVLLKGNSFTSFAGSKVALALLFPMEKLFENYIAEKFKKLLSRDFIFRKQDKRYSLFDSPNKAFALRPDIVLEHSSRTIVMDTKWKVLDIKARNMGISQSDMYQMYAYGKKYQANEIYLIYPRSYIHDMEMSKYSSDDGVIVNISFVDLKEVNKSLLDIIKRAEKQ